MKTKPFTKGFTLIELLVVISIIAMLAAGAYAGYGKLMPGFRAATAQSKSQAIFKMMQGYATERGGDFPTAEANDANANLRELFKAKLFDGGSEGQFTLDADPWCKGKKLADGDVGTEPEFEQALDTGECSWTYVRGLTSSSDGKLPILINSGVAGTPGVFAKDQGVKGGVLSGTKAVCTFVSGATESIELDPTDYAAKKKLGGNLVNIMSSDFETNTENVCEPSQ